MTNEVVNVTGTTGDVADAVVLAIVAKVRQATDCMMAWDYARDGNDDAMGALAMMAHKETERAMAAKGVSVAGAIGQLQLLDLYFSRCDGPGENDQIVMTPIKNLLRLLPLGA